jgi:hypothetical protein
VNVFSRIVYTCLITTMPAISVSQESESRIGGTVYGPEGETVSNAPMQLTNLANENYLRTQSDDSGRYEFAGIIAGSYQLVVSTPLNISVGTYRPYESPTIELAPRENQKFVIRLKQSPSIGTIGDDIAVVSGAIRDRQEIPDLPAPRLPNNKPDFSGVWLIGSAPFPEKPDAYPWAQKLFEERAESDFREHPHTDCLPGDAPIPWGGGSPFIMKIVHKPELMVVLLEDYPGYRQIFLDGRTHPDDPNPSWVGHSIGRWDSDVLVVDTIGYNDRGWMRGYPRTEYLHIVERYTRNEYGTMVVEAMIEDPKVFKKSWKLILPMDLAPQEDLLEYVCENNKW